MAVRVATSERSPATTSPAHSVVGSDGPAVRRLGTVGRSAPAAVRRPVTVGRSAPAVPAVSARLLGPLARRIAETRDDTTVAREAAFVQRQWDVVTKLTSYFSPEIRGVEHVPLTGPALVVGNHSCLFYMPDAWITGLAIAGRRGFDTPTYALGYDLLFAIPGVGPYLRRLGLLPAAPEEAAAALGEGAAVLVYPGGDQEACRPWTKRNRVDLAGHTGFIRLALEHHVPVVPVVAHGSHDAVIVLSRGDRLARLMGLHLLRIKVFPIVVGPPFGVTTALVPPLPLPSSITIEFLPALEWRRHGRRAASDEAFVASCYEEISGVMQATLDRLQRERPHPVARGVSNLMSRVVAR